jgi:glycosyltransferase involved in cell wall biosynthesis
LAQQEGVVSEPLRLGLYSPWPVYYHAPLYRRVAADQQISFIAIFGSDIGVRRRVSNGYGGGVDFGVPVLEGYESIFLRKAARNASGGSLALRDWDISSVVRRGRFDALWLNGYNSITHLTAAATQLGSGRALLVREEQTLLHSRSLPRRLAKSIGLRLLLHRAYGLYIGTENRRWFRHWGVPDDRLFFTPYTVDNEGLQEDAQRLYPKREQLLRAFGLDAGKPVILTVCRFVSNKQPLVLIEAFRRLRRDHEASLLLVGSGPLEAEMRRAVEAAAVPDVAFAGFLSQTQVARAYAAADVFVLASTNETWGLVVNEAMNFRLPIVVTDGVGSAADLVVSGENGFVVPRESPDALLAAMRRLIESADLRRAFGSVSQRKIGVWNYDAAAEGVVAALLASTDNLGRGVFFDSRGVA